MLQYIYSFFEEEKMVFIKLLDGIDKNGVQLKKPNIYITKLEKIHLMMKDLPTEIMLNLCIKYFIEMLI